MKNLKAYIQLLRLPNLFTLPGDCFIGMLLAGSIFSWSAFFTALFATSALYLFGIVFNDICDEKIDEAERPERPLPSGAVSKPLAYFLAIVFLSTGLCLTVSVWQLSFSLALVIFLYDLFLKKIPIVGVLSMGFCRGLNVAMTTAIFGGADYEILGVFSDVWAVAIFVIAYIFSLSVVAKHEAEKSAKVSLCKRYLPAILFSIAVLITTLVRGLSFLPIIFGLLIVLFLWFVCRPKSALKISRIVELLLCGYIFLQAWVCFVLMFDLTILSLLFFCVISFYFSLERFYAS